MLGLHIQRRCAAMHPHHVRLYGWRCCMRLGGRRPRRVRALVQYMFRGVRCAMRLVGCCCMGWAEQSGAVAYSFVCGGTCSIQCYWFGPHRCKRIFVHVSMTSYRQISICVPASIPLVPISPCTPPPPSHSLGPRVIFSPGPRASYEPRMGPIWGPI
jgi:hypothetical protein